MTINTGYSPNKYIGNGVTTDFSIDWNPISVDFIKVVLENRTTREQEVKTLGVDYTATITDNDGIVSFMTAPSSSYNIILSRDVSLTQEVSYSQNNSYRGTLHEDSLDKIVAQNQQQAEELGRSAKLPLGSDISSLELPNPEAKKSLIWNDNENALINSSSNIDDVEGYRDETEAFRDEAEEFKNEATESAEEAASSASTALSSSASATESAEEAAIWNQGSPAEVSSLGGVLSCKDYAIQAAGMVPQATELVAGKARIATAQEVTEGTNDSTIVTPKKLNTEFRRQAGTLEFYQNAGGNLEEVTSGIYKVPVGSKFTLASGETFVRNDEPLVSLLGESDGEYYVFVGTRYCKTYPSSNVKIQKEEPTSPFTNEIWFNPYASPYTSKKWDGFDWEDFPYALSNTLVTVDSSATPVVAFPLMTGENLPAGQYSSASSTAYTTDPSWHAFDGKDGWSYWEANKPGPYRLTRWADTAVTANAVYLSARSKRESIGSFTLRGSNNGVDWVDIQTYTDLPLQDYADGGLTLLFPKSTYKYFDIYNAFDIDNDLGISLYEVSYRLIQPYNTTDIGNRTAYTEAKDITPVSGVSFDVLSSINGGGWTATSDGVLYATIGFGMTNENRIYIDGVQITQITSREDDSHGQINSCTTVILHKGQVVTLGSRPLAGAIFLPARKGSFE